jgi:hypothetical protein
MEMKKRSRELSNKNAGRRVGGEGRDLESVFFSFFF